MPMDKKKLAAAMAAVTAYITTGEAAAAAQNNPPAEADAQTAEVMPAPRMNLWGVTGRQALMHSSTMMQLRMFK